MPLSSAKVPSETFDPDCQSLRFPGHFQSISNTRDFVRRHLITTASDIKMPATLTTDMTI